MASKTVEEYAAALEELDARKAAGTVSGGVWEVQRARLLAEVAQPARTGPVNFLIFAGVLFSMLGMLSIVGYLIGALS